MAKLFPTIQRFKGAKITMRSNNTYCISDLEAKRIGALVAGAPCAVGDIDGWYPTVEQAKKLSENVVNKYSFIRWIVESNPELSEQHLEACKILINALKKITIIKKKERVKRHE